MFYVMKRKKNENGARAWTQVRGSVMMNADRTTLDVIVADLNESDRVFAYKVFNDEDTP